MKLFCIVGMTTIAGFAFVHPASAMKPSETVLHSFKGNKGGSAPYSSLIVDSNGFLYGSAPDYQSSSHACGVVFRLRPGKKGKQSSFTVLHAFNKQNGDGCAPTGGLVADPSGVLYGTTAGGGKDHGGTVFSLTPPAAGGKNWTETILCSFPRFSTPVATLIRDVSGVLYGTTQIGEANQDGAVFALTPPAQGQSTWTENTLYSFKGGDDGANPDSSVIEGSSGALYGTTFAGANTACSNNLGCGTVYELSPPAAGQSKWTETILHAFSGGTDGGNPWSSVIFDKNGNLVGATIYGTSGGGGAVFELSPPSAGQTSWTESQLHSFTGSSKDGGLPYGDLIFDSSGNLYGTTLAGGQTDYGTVFRLRPPKAGKTDWSVTLLHTFTGPPDGLRPYSGVTLVGRKTLFGTTLQGGANPSVDYGTIFEVTR